MSTKTIRRDFIRAMPEDGAAITPNDSADLAHDSVCYIGGAGNITVTTVGGSKLTFVGVEKGVALFVGQVRCQNSGLHGYTVRVLPRHEDLANPFEPRLIVWGG